MLRKALKYSAWVIGGLVAQKKISRVEAKRRLEASNSETLRRIGAGVTSRPAKKATPAKKAAVKKVAPAAGDIDSMTIPQLREEAKRQDKKIPSSVRRKADIVAFLKGEQKGPDAKKTETPESLRKQAENILAEDNSRAGRLKAQDLIRRADRLEGIQKKGPVKKAAPETKAPEPETARKPQWGTLKTNGLKNGDEAMYYGQDRKTPRSQGIRVRIEQARYGGYELIGPDGKRVGSGANATRSWFGPVPSASEKKAPETRRPAEKGLLFMTLPEIRQRAKDKNLKIPGDLKTKKSIVDWLADAEVAQENGEKIPLSDGQRQHEKARKQREAEAAEKVRLREEAKQLREQQREDTKRLRQIEREQATQRRAEERERKKREDAARREEEKRQHKSETTNDYDSLTGPGWDIAMLRSHALSQGITIPRELKFRSEIREHIIKERARLIAKRRADGRTANEMVREAESLGIFFHSSGWSPERIALQIESIKQTPALLGIDPKKYKPVPWKNPSGGSRLVTGENSLGNRWLESITRTDTDPNHPILISEVEIESPDPTSNTGVRRTVLSNVIVHRRDGVFYTVEMGSQNFDKPYAASRVVFEFEDYYKRLPDGWQQSVKTFNWFNNANPADNYWKHKFNSPDHTSLATAGYETMTFWAQSPRAGGPKGHSSSLDHEMGHLVDNYHQTPSLGADWHMKAELDAPDQSVLLSSFKGRALDSFLTLAPDMTRGFPYGVTSYGKSSAREDFAESVSLYRQGVIGKATVGGVENVDVYFRDMFPRRAAILDRLFPELAKEQLRVIREQRGS